MYNNGSTSTSTIKDQFPTSNSYCSVYSVAKQEGVTVRSYYYSYYDDDYYYCYHYYYYYYYLLILFALVSVGTEP